VETAEHVRGFGAAAEAFECDVAKDEQLAPLVDKVVEAFGGVDILINNANYSVLGPVMQVQRKHVQKAFEVGPLATLSLMQLCHPLMVERGGGAVVNMVSSAAVRWDMTNYGAYGASKEAIRSLTRAAASEWGG